MATCRATGPSPWEATTSYEGQVPAQTWTLSGSSRHDSTCQSAQKDDARRDRVVASASMRTNRAAENKEADQIKGDMEARPIWTGYTNIWASCSTKSARAERAAQRKEQHDCALLSEQE